MPMLNTNKLKGKVGGSWLAGVPTKSTQKGEEYRCPVCAINGGDEGGQHLIVFKERGNFACAAYPNDRAHRSKIWDMVGIRSNGKPDPIIPRKIEQKATFIGRHIMDMDKEAEEVRRRDADLVAERKERERLEKEEEHRKWLEQVRAEAIEKARRLEIMPKTEPQHIDTISNKVQIGTFGTPFLSSSNMPPPPNKDYTKDNTVGIGGGYVPPTYEKASQTSQVRPTMFMGASPMPEGYCRTCWNSWGKMVRVYDDIGCEVCTARKARTLQAA